MKEYENNFTMATVMYKSGEGAESAALPREKYINLQNLKEEMKEDEKRFGEKNEYYIYVYSTCI